MIINNAFLPFQLSELEKYYTVHVHEAQLIIEWVEITAGRWEKRTQHNVLQPMKKRNRLINRKSNISKSCKNKWKYVAQALSFLLLIVACTWVLWHIFRQRQRGNQFCTKTSTLCPNNLAQSNEFLLLKWQVTYEYSLKIIIAMSTYKHS